MKCEGFVDVVVVQWVVLQLCVFVFVVVVDECLGVGFYFGQVEWFCKVIVSFEVQVVYVFFYGVMCGQDYYGQWVFVGVQVVQYFQFVYVWQVNVENSECVVLCGEQ